jgi:hypothetical protein
MTAALKIPRVHLGASVFTSARATASPIAKTPNLTAAVVIHGAFAVKSNAMRSPSTLYIDKNSLSHKE